MNATDPPQSEGLNPTGSERSQVVRAAGVVGAATFLSRICGFLRDMVVAAYFGAGMATDAFFVAFRIPNLLRSLLAEGSLTIAFVPVFTEYLKTKSREDALKLANVAFTLLSIILAVLSVAGILFAPWIVRLIAWGFASSPEHFDLTVYLTRLMFPYIFFIALVALCMGILNSLRHFAVPALSPVVLNLSIIAAAVFLRGLFDEPVVALALGVLIGGVLQLLMQFPALARMGAPFRPDFTFSHPGVRTIGILMIPAVFGAAVYQVNIFVATLLASFLPTGSVSYLYYADRIVQLPLGVFALAVGTAALPSLSRQAALEEIEEFKKTISFALRVIFFVTIPCMIGLFVLREPIISVLFQRGAFDVLSTTMTADALLFYAMGLWAFSGIKVLVSVFYSLKDTATPVKIAFVAFIVNVFASLLLMGPMAHRGLALAISIASSVNIIILFLVLRKKIGPFLGAEFGLSIIRCLAASLVMGASMVVLLLLMGWDVNSPFPARLAMLAAAMATGAAAFVLTALSLRSGEMIFLRDRLRGIFTR